MITFGVSKAGIVNSECEPYSQVFDIYSTNDWLMGKEYWMDDYNPLDEMLFNSCNTSSWFKEERTFYRQP